MSGTYIPLFHPTFKLIFIHLGFFWAIKPDCFWEVFDICSCVVICCFFSLFLDIQESSFLEFWGFGIFDDFASILFVEMPQRLNQQAFVAFFLVFLVFFILFSMFILYL